MSKLIMVACKNTDIFSLSAPVFLVNLVVPGILDAGGMSRLQCTFLVGCSPPITSQLFATMKHEPIVHPKYPHEYKKLTFNEMRITIITTSLHHYITTSQMTQTDKWLGG